jgi:site-specific DNA-cytosine methylase
MGEQVAAAVGKDWLDGVCSDLEGIGYACGAAVVPACAVDAPHRRDRLWFVADAAHGVRNRVGRLRAYGNAIVPQVAAEVLGAYLEIAQEPRGRVNGGEHVSSATRVAKRRPVGALEVRA